MQAQDFNTYLINTGFGYNFVIEDLELEELSSKIIFFGIQDFLCSLRRG
jgi:hypothetical protein